MFYKGFLGRMFYLKIGVYQILAPELVENLTKYQKKKISREQQEHNRCNLVTPAE